jgi:hypothetical protein
MLCLLICFLLSHSFLFSDPVPLMHQHLTHSMLLGDAGMCFISPAPCGTRHVGPMCTHKVLWLHPDRHSKGAELQGWPVPQGTSSPSGPGGEGNKDCLWVLKLSSLVIPASLLRLPVVCTCPLPLLSALFLTPGPRKHAGNGRPLAMVAFAGEWEGMPHPTSFIPCSKVRTMESDFKTKIFTKKLLALDSFGHGVVFWIWVIVLLRETLSNLLAPALIDVKFLFKIPSSCSA